VKHLEKTYKKKFTAIDDLTLRIKKNEVLGILAPNGAGKTSFIKILTMGIPASKGEVIILG
jgi:ABC-type multidrug transport system ATPase subunit